MQIRGGVHQFVIGIYPGIPHDWKSLESLAAAGLEMSSAKERRVVLAFLNVLLDGGYSDARYEDAWNVQSRATISALEAIGSFSK